MPGRNRTSSLRVRNPTFCPLNYKHSSLHILPQSGRLPGMFKTEGMQFGEPEGCFWQILKWVPRGSALIAQIAYWAVTSEKAGLPKMMVQITTDSNGIEHEERVPWTEPVASTGSLVKTKFTDGRQN